MKSPSYWNHNTAYYPWIRKNTARAERLLDVGCGDGALCAYLDDGNHTIMGIDPDENAVRRSHIDNESPRVMYQCCKFEEYEPHCSFDAIIFSASIHHMDMIRTLCKAKEMLSPNGLILIVGLAEPSSYLDYAVELLRIVPSKAVSMIRHIRTAENLNLITYYRYPAMDSVRRTVRNLLPGAKLRYGLHFRYLLKWRNC